MTILDTIIQDKKREVALKKTLVSTAQLEKSALFDRKGNSLAIALRNSNSGIITEHKRRSPSKAEISYKFSVEEVTKGYQDAGACGISVLTDGKYFGGSTDDLLLARATVGIPLLRKEFIVDEYQLLESKALGADIILLIAAVLSPEEIRSLSYTAQSLGLEVLLEVHSLQELENAIMPGLAMIGVNNRNLRTFEVDTNYSKELASAIPDDFIKVSESGIYDTATVKELREYGYKGFLIGENFMRSANPGLAAATFISNL